MPIIHGLPHVTFHDRLLEVYIAEGLGIKETAQRLGWKTNNYKIRAYLVAHGIPLKKRGAQPGSKNTVHAAMRNGNWRDLAKRTDVRFKISRAKMGPKNAMWKGGKTPPNWHRSELRRLGVDLTTCSECPARTRLIHVHHKDGNRGNNDPSNLEVLCPKCHGHAHRKPRKKYEFVCVGCGSKFTSYSRKRGKNKKKFCSRICYAKFMKRHPLRYWLGKKRPDLSIKFSSSGNPSWGGD